jgi:hypothetical protein
MGQPVDKTMNSGHLTNALMGAKNLVGQSGGRLLWDPVLGATHHTDS